MRILTTSYFIVVLQLVCFAQDDFPSNVDLRKNILTIGHFAPASCGYVNSQLSIRGLNNKNNLVQVMENLGAYDLGTGFIYDINGDKYIITCEHVILNSDSIVGYNSNYEAFDLELVGGDTFYDVAVLKFKKPEEFIHWDGLKFDFTPQTASKVFAVGYWNWNGESNVNQGELISDDLSLIDKDMPTIKMGFLESDAQTDSGYSGGFLLNLEGQVIGMNSFINVRNSNSFALTSSIIKRIVDDIIIQKENQLERPFLGIQFTQTVDGAGVMINDVIDKSPASILKEKIIGKSIISIDNIPIKDIYDVLQKIEETVTVSKEVNLSLKDGDSEVSIKIKPQKLTDNFHEEIARHAIEYNEEDHCESVLMENGHVSIYSNHDQKEIVMTAGLHNNRIYCIPDLVQLGIVVRIFSLHGELRIGTDDQFLKGRWIWFSQNDNVRVLYY